MVKKSNSKKDPHHSAIWALVAIVAIVAIFFLISDDYNDLAGEAYNAQIGENSKKDTGDDDCDGKVDDLGCEVRNEEWVPPCSDSDESEDVTQFYERGQTSGDNGVYYDFCKSSEALGEWSCEDGEAIVEYYTCNCDKGICEEMDAWPSKWRG